MATITKRGVSWFVQVRRQGVTKCASFKTKSAAKAWATHTESLILSGKHKAKSEKTLRDALDKYVTEVTPAKRGQRWEEIRINAFKRLDFVDYKLTDVSTPVLAVWRDDRLKVVKSSTVNRELNLLSSVFEQARREWQWLDINPVHDVRRPPQPKHRERIFTDDEVDRIIKQLGYDDAVYTKQHIIALAFLFALETAMRREEITGLTWDRIDIKRRFLTLPRTKNGDARNVPLSIKAIELLNRLRQFDKPFDVDKDVLSALFGRACKAANVLDATFHDGRATALTRLSTRLNILELARLAGHRDIKSLNVYYRETAENLAKKLD